MTNVVKDGDVVLPEGVTLDKDGKRVVYQGAMSAAEAQILANAWNARFEANQFDPTASVQKKADSHVGKLTAAGDGTPPIGWTHR